MAKVHYKVYYPYGETYDHRAFYTKQDAIRHAEKENDFMKSKPELFPAQEVHVIQITRTVLEVYS